MDLIEMSNQRKMDKQIIVHLYWIYAVIKYGD